MWLSFFGLAGLVSTTRNKYLIFASAWLFIILFTSPQFLYLSYGSDAGVLAELINYADVYERIDLSRDIAVNSYFQWPLSIFFHKFLADLLQMGVYPTLTISFIFFSIGITGGFFILWNSNSNHQTSSIRAVFWGIAVYFCGLYWLLNWQTVPYTFALLWFIPLFTMLDDRSISARILALLFFIALIESHAMLGIWLLIVTIIIFALDIFKIQKLIKGNSYTIIILLFVVQVSLLIYKNSRFFPNMISSLQGLYSQVLLISTSNRALALQTSQALINTPDNIIGNILKTMGWISLAFIAAAFILSTIYILVKHRVRIRELAFIMSGLLYFVIGTQIANIGIRSIMLISLAPAYFLINSLWLRSGASKLILFASMIGFLIFPSALIRSHQEAANFITPADLYIRDFLSNIHDSSISEIQILQEHVKPLSLNQKHPKISPRRIGYSYIWRCSGGLLLNDTYQLRTELNQISVSLTSALDESLLNAPLIYDNGVTQLRYIRDCEMLKFSQ